MVILFWDIVCRVLYIISLSVNHRDFFKCSEIHIFCYRYLLGELNSS